LALFSVALAACLTNVSVTAQTPKAERPKLYDTAADGKQQIADALKIASAENKRVLLKIGANW
jgi:hypothetical protein